MFAAVQMHIIHLQAFLSAIACLLHVLNNGADVNQHRVLLSAVSLLGHHEPVIRSVLKQLSIPQFHHPGPWDAGSVLQALLQAVLDCIITFARLTLP
jgi:hypothetical protein